MTTLDAMAPNPVSSIDEAVAQADLRVLLMAMVHISGDRRWLREPYLPGRDVNLISDEQSGFSDEIAAEIRAAAVAMATNTPVIDDPGDELMTEMLSVCLGQSVPAEYAPMLREELGFCSRDVEAAVTPTHDVLIVGAGASGIALGARLERMGVPYTIVERMTSVGGVWRDNRYPGAGVDTPNHAYSFSFMPPWRWSRFFAPQPELRAYMEAAAKHTGVIEQIEFETELVDAKWKEKENRWQIRLATPGGIELRTATVLVGAVGPLSDPKVPEFAGRDQFSGPAFHSKHWPDDLDVNGKRVAVIGTGASAMQIVPAIVDDVAHLTIFQRSPQWARAIPRYHDPIPPGSQWLFEHYPFYAQWFRATMLWRYGDGLLPTLKKDPDWPYPERSLNRHNDRHRQQMTDQIIDALDGRPDLIEKCLPDYPPYGKRILLDNGWFDALRQPNVELVPRAVTSLSANAIIDESGDKHPADVIVFATGFHVTAMTAQLAITGRNGQTLRAAWADDNPSAYLGITVPGFPNLFCMQGPNTGLGHGGSAILQAESMARYITSCLAAMAEHGVTAIEVRQDAHDAYVAKVDAEHESLIWTHPGMTTYYRNPHGRVTVTMPWRLVDYWTMTHDVDLADYHLTH